MRFTRHLQVIFKMQRDCGFCEVHTGYSYAIKGPRKRYDQVSSEVDVNIPWDVATDSVNGFGWGILDEKMSCLQQETRI